jgi:hypothetical protein
VKPSTLKRLTLSDEGRMARLRERRTEKMRELAKINEQIRLLLGRSRRRTERARLSRVWTGPNDPTGPARLIWAAVYREPWPTGWRVEWTNLLRITLGQCCYDRRRIVLSCHDRDTIGTLLHEFVHMRCGREFRHGQEFDRLVKSSIARLLVSSLPSKPRAATSPGVGATAARPAETGSVGRPSAIRGAA